MKAIPTPVLSSPAAVLFIVVCFTCLSFISVADAEVESSLYELKNQTELSALESRNPSIIYIDTRGSEQCLQKSIEGGLCISPDQLRYPSGRLANFRDLNWLVGTYGVSTESVTIVIGDNKESNYMVAAVLYLLGVKQVAVWDSDFASIASLKKTGGGRHRGILRSEYFSNPMRDRLIALDNDLQQVFDSTEKASIVKLVATEFVGHLIDSPGQVPIVTGSTPSSALVNFTDQLLKHKSGAIRVHTNGLSERSFADFGYVQANHSFAIITAALILLPAGVFLLRRKLS